MILIKEQTFNFCRKLGKMSQNLSSAAVVIGAFRIKYLKAPITTAADDKFRTSLLIFEKKLKTVCRQMILMKYHDLFIIFNRQEILKLLSASN